MKLNKFILCIIVILGVISPINGHGADITENVIVIANETTGIIAKKYIDENNLDIKVYEFATESDVYHQLEHALTNPNKRILLVSFQDTGNKFLNEHKELSNQVIVCISGDEDNIKNAIIQLNSTLNGTDETNNLNIDYTSLILLVVIIGLISTIGIIFLKKKK